MTAQQKGIVLAVSAGSVFLVYLLEPILAPFLVGILLAYLGDPLVDLIEARGLGRTLAVTLVFLLITLVLVGVVLILVPLLVRETSAVIQRIPDFIAWVEQMIRPWMLSTLGVDLDRVDVGGLRESLLAHWREAGGIVGQLVSEMTRSGYALVMGLANLALVPVVAFYLMRDWDLLLHRIRELLPPAVEGQAVALVRECDEVVSAFLRGQLLIMCILGAIYACGLWAVGLELALLIGLLAGLASIVPYLGFIVGIGAASVAALFQFQDSLHLVYVAIVFGVGQVLEGWVLTPLLVGDRIGLHPVAVIFAILAGGQLFGFVGVLLALPAAAIIMVFLRHLHRSYRGSEWFGAGDTGRADAETSVAGGEER